ncbi:MAG: UDP-N-acetylglucosamine--N-acetylmuramyl-(pentapeptide) pyrophosphoryl-undecaprenol N-acetylglucosamine transferase [Candidatus Eremiobacteraeota bacterium]|nr:UDP-N-acetylglucosamine--N-acetylmuramyl-(pentapeptide) pyrophosphoryl-undecaprenol N-acetylglucosamine transferase [Candidatus Eremiobacteraeota bacterium]
MTVIFAGGGTGGHLYPAIAIADALRERQARVAFIGAADRLESTIVPKAGYRLFPIASRSMPRRPSLDLFATIGSNLKGIAQSLRLLASQRPDIVIATGGYVAFPVTLAARIRRLLRLSTAPIVLLEPNAAPGLTNRLLAPIVDQIWDVESTGVPIRATLRALPPRDDAIARLGLDPSLRTLVSIGGSQGARSINDALCSLVSSAALPPGWQLFALTGENDYQRVHATIPNARPYLDDMADAYAVADLVLARAGASTLAELAALRKPAILVPYPFAAERHQEINAARFEAAGAAVVLGDEELRAGAFPALFAQTVEPSRLQALAAGAQRLGGADPLNAILARIDTLVPRKS